MKGYYGWQNDYFDPEPDDEDIVDDYRDDEPIARCWNCHNLITSLDSMCPNCGMITHEEEAEIPFA